MSVETIITLMELQKQNIFNKIIDELSYICYNMENRNWNNIDKLIEKLKEIPF